MLIQPPIDINFFFVIGINYKKSDASVRGRFSISHDQYENLIAAAPAYGVSGFFVLSTCNRTEMYGFAESPGKLSSLLCSQTSGELDEFLTLAYQYSGERAVEHLFEVSAGLDSQILGDYEIIGQLRQSAKFSKERNQLGAYLERIVNDVLKASKKIRTNTALSGGTVSVSFAAIQFIKSNCPGDKKILLLGAGKIGANTCKNLTVYLPGSSITVMNRSLDKAIEISNEYGTSYKSFDELAACVNDFDIILVATNAEEPVLKASHFSGIHPRLVIDLSVPSNVACDVAELAHITLVDVDELSKIKDETLIRRSAEIPKARQIIAEHLEEFMEWYDMRRHVPVLKDVKNKLLSIQAKNIIEPGHFGCMQTVNPEEKIQRVINGMAVKMRAHNQRGCYYIEAINDFISTASGR